MFGYLEGLPGGIELEQKVKRYKKIVELHRRFSEIQNTIYFYVLYMHIVLFLICVLFRFLSDRNVPHVLIMLCNS